MNNAFFCVGTDCWSEGEGPEERSWWFWIGNIGWHFDRRRGWRRFNFVIDVDISHLRLDVQIACRLFRAEVWYYPRLQQVKA